MYEFDVAGVLPWRRRPNPSNKNDDLIDLQYWTLTGGLDLSSRWQLFFFHAAFLVLN